MDREEMHRLTAIGLMAGTSLDGVDVAVLRTDGETVHKWGPAMSFPYDAPTRATIISATKAALEGREEANDIAVAGNMVTSAHIEAVRNFLSETGLRRDEIDVIGFHGQTILHRPPLDASSIGRTWQIGGGGIIAEELGIDVVDQFRQADMAAGGEGAPFAPIYHAALVEACEFDGAVAVLNLGGVANITYVPADRDPMGLVAFDCGPGNGLIDEWMVRHTGHHMDEDGALAASGSVDDEVLRMMALNPYLKRKAPKSLDRYDFKLKAADHLSPPDGAATLTAFSAECVARSVALLPEAPAYWVACGGGRHNPVLMAELGRRLEGQVLVAEEAGWRGDMIEAEAFAYLAVRSLRKLPLSFPKTTRVPQPLSGGSYHRKPVNL
ncbi:anhydro-N-acetylmuramic acid kinase [Parvularcula marina]|nr:anhydro-N-acetylmuramic acid kinase [Parvularcula marina]